MPGDDSRDTSAHGRREGYSRVLLQQGRVQLDADWNEQAELAHHRDRTMARDAVGGCGVPLTTPDAFRIGDGTGLGDGTGTGGFAIGAGRIYVDGLLVENDVPHDYLDQPFLPEPDPLVGVLPGTPGGGDALVYLQVFERDVTVAEDDRLAEVALGGADTATRTQTVWQVRVAPLAAFGLTAATVRELAAAGTGVPLPGAPPADGAGLVARVLPPGEPGGTGADRSCLLDPDAGFLGVENQLYRVEVHRSGVVGGGPGTRPPTFTWSRDNGSIVAPVAGGPGGLELVESPRVTGDDFPSGTWVELIDRRQELARRPGHLAQLRRPPGEPGLVLDPPPPVDVAALDRPRLRRWDQTGPLPTAEGIEVTGGFDDVEAGIQVRFAPGTYRTGDHWLIPARTATADIEWPPDGAVPPGGGDPVVPPLGRDDHACPLALVTAAGVEDLRVRFQPLVALRPDLPDVVESVTLAPALADVDAPDTIGWAQAVAQALTPAPTSAAAGDGARRVDGVMPVLLPHRTRVRSLRLLGAVATSRGDLAVSLLRFGVAEAVDGEPRAEHVVARLDLPLTPGPVDRVVALPVPHEVDATGFRYVLRALALRQPNTGAFDRGDVRLHTIQITHSRG